LVFFLIFKIIQYRNLCILKIWLVGGGWVLYVLYNFFKKFLFLVRTVRKC